MLKFKVQSSKTRWSRARGRLFELCTLHFELRRRFAVFLLAAIALAFTCGGKAFGADAAGDPGVPNAVAGGWLETLLFNLVAGGVVISVIGVCVSRNIVRMAVWLFMCLGSVAMVYFMLAATFLGAIQLIVYAGGTLVLLIFGVMLTSKSPWVKFEAGALETIAAGGVCVALTAALCMVLGRTTWHAAEAIVPGPAITRIGEELITKYLVPFEVAGVLLFIVMVGAAYLARQED